jgi:hypothetical protein
MKKIILIIGIVLSFSCEEEKTEFVNSKVYSHLFLIKSPPNDKMKLPEIDFYRYSWNTKYFLDHEEDPGGFSSKELGNYPEDDLASFIVSKCKNDTTKLVGRFHFYGNRSNLSQLDTIIYKCD